MRRCYFSKNYVNVQSGGNKAKTDVEKIMDSMGFTNVGRKQTRYQSKIIGYFITLLGVLKAIYSIKNGDILVLQYPLKKYYAFLCKVAHLKGAVVITLIHDLGSFRRKKLTRDKERRRLSNTDYIIALSEKMKNWLINDGYKQAIGVLEIWDYLSEAEPDEKKVSNDMKILYTGNLHFKTHNFFTAYDKTIKKGKCHFTVCGNTFDQDDILHKNHFTYEGFKNPDDIISSSSGNFGLVWYGNSIDKIDGAYGDWLKLTSPHRTSLYVRCHIPVIVWNKAAQADFVRKHRIGLCIGSLEELESKLSMLTSDEYESMRNNATTLSKQLKAGHFFTKAYIDAENYFLNLKQQSL